jgi:TetR/AcrR family transcriptional regulator, transcriptional repressor for nem operon
MSKGDQTRSVIIQKAASLLNQQGYLTVPMSQIMAATGFEKGGIYNHFKSKEELALAVFDYSVQITLDRNRERMAAHAHSIDQLTGILDTFLGKGTAALPGGCPIMNAAIEADDAHAGLRERARQGMDALRALVMETVTAGISRREIRPETDADVVTTILISTLEGALMLSKLYQDMTHLRRVTTHLESYLQGLRLV